MHSTDTTIEIDVPASVAYDAWANLERLPQHLSVVKSIAPVDGSDGSDEGDITHWVVEFGPVRREFDAEVTEDIEGKRMAWKSVTGPHHAGVVTFHHLDDHRCSMAVQLDFDPEGVAENVAAALQLVDAAVEYDLGAFKATMESEHTVGA